MDLALTLVADACPWVRRSPRLLARLRCACRAWRDAAASHLDGYAFRLSASDPAGLVDLVCSAVASPSNRFRRLCLVVNEWEESSMTCQSFAAKLREALSLRRSELDALDVTLETRTAPGALLAALSEGIYGEVRFDFRATSQLEWDECDLGALGSILSRGSRRRVALLGGSLGNEAVGWCLASLIPGDFRDDEDEDEDEGGSSEGLGGGWAADAAESRPLSGHSIPGCVEVAGVDADVARDVARLVRFGTALKALHLSDCRADALASVFRALSRRSPDLGELHVDRVHGTLSADSSKGLGLGIVGVRSVSCRRSPGLVSPLLHAMATSSLSWKIEYLDLSDSHGFDVWEQDRRLELRLGDAIASVLVKNAAHLKRVNLSGLLWPDARWLKRPKRGREPVADMLLPIVRGVAHACQGYTSLHALDLSHNQVFSPDAQGHAGIGQEIGNMLWTVLQQHQEHLSRLNVRGLDLGQAGLCRLAAGLEGNSTIAWLDLGCTPLGTEGALVLANAVASNRGLRHLNLDCCGIDGVGVKAVLSSLLTHTDLVSLCLGSYSGVPCTSSAGRPNKVRGIDAADLGGGRMSKPTLRSLELSGCRVVGQTVEALLNSASAQTLCRLDLSHNPGLGRAGLDVLFHRMASTPRAALPRLSDLDVSHCDLRGVCADAIARVLDADTGTLTSLNLDGNPVDRASEVALARKSRRLHRGLPEVMVSSTSFHETWVF